MTNPEIDIVIVGAGPVGLMCAHLANLSGLKAVALDKSTGPIDVGRADALNARTLQLFEVAKLFDEVYPLGKPCNTSSTWENGAFTSRQSSWWDDLEGCFHKHFLMIGQSYVEKILAKRLERSANPVRRSNEVRSVEVTDDGCLTHLANGESIRSKYVIAADGSRSKIREEFRIPFQITRPQIIWAVVDGVLETDFPKVPEIIVFQSTTSDVAWIPRERNIDRFYVRMDTKSFTFDDVLSKINRAVSPHRISFETIEWQSQFSVKESVAESFSVQNRIFFAGDACHIHSVNGGQGLNTGLADAFNLIWKLSMVEKHGASKSLLGTYESERKPVAISVIETSGELVRSTKHSDSGTHAQDYVKIVQKRAGNITGMGVRYGDQGLVGTRLHDISIRRKSTNFRLYSLLDYSKYTLLVFGQQETDSLARYPNMNVIRISTTRHDTDLWTEDKRYLNASILVRPDAYIEAITTDEDSQLCET